MRILLFILLSLSVRAQVLDSACLAPVGNAYVNNCVMQPIVPSLLVNDNASVCFTFKPTYEWMNLGYIYVNGDCGPFAPYTWLNYSIFTTTCDSLVETGNIHPLQINTFINLDTSQTYIICYYWQAKCNQYAACPVITESLLSVDWLYVKSKAIDEGVEVSFGTASETNALKYFIQKNINSHWLNLSEIKACGNCIFTNHYVYFDTQPAKHNYYRIAEMDINGQLSYSAMTYTFLSAIPSPCAYISALGVFCGYDYNSLKPGIYIKYCETYQKIIVR